jgi:quaternary ammonium compound-resistance protein SugE
MSWILLVLAGLFEIAWAVGLKYTEGFTRLWPSVGTLAAIVVSLALLGVVLFGESASLVRLACVGLILIGLIGLKLVTPSAP